ncbi:hypothetical protein [Vibrio alginolyticus]|uniref:hypothetical protein n=1 Tax=Vibrio alginolyticus TaxID=663 RepID=UPI0037551DCB
MRRIERLLNAFRSTHTIAQKRTQTENEQLRKVLAEIHGKDEVDTAMSILDYDHLAECRKLYSKYQIVAVDATGIGEHLDTLLSRLDPRTVLIVINAQEWLADEKGNSTQNAMSVLTSNYPKVLIFDPDSNGYSVLHESDIRRKYYRVVHIPQPCT